MDDRAALEALVAGDPPEQEAAKATLTNRYLAKLMKTLETRLGFSQEAASIGAADALMRLFEKASEMADSALVKDQGVWRWLLKVGVDAGRDHLKWARRHQLLDDEDDVADEHGEQERSKERIKGTNPLSEASARELGRRVLEFVFDQKQPERGILLFDMHAELEELMGDELELHETELIDCSKQHGVWTRNALRSARTRVREALRTFLERVRP